jgi:hypothetical protein
LEVKVAHEVSPPDIWRFASTTILINQSLVLAEDIVELTTKEAALIRRQRGPLYRSSKGYPWFLFQEFSKGAAE